MYAKMFIVVFLYSYGFMNDMEESRLIKNLIEASVKAKKFVRAYPENNPIYIKTINNTFKKFTEALNHTGDIALHIKQYEILFHDKQVYYNPERHDNLSLLFFKDGLRELTFKKGLTIEELEAFLRVISLDERELIEDDIVTLLWEKDFRHIKYVIDDTVLEEDNEYEIAATKNLLEQTTPADEIQRAYSDAFKIDDVKVAEVESLTESDLRNFMIEFERDSENKLYRAVNIIFELYHQARDRDDLEDVASLMESIIEFSVKNADLESVVDVLKKVKAVMRDEHTYPGANAFLKKTIDYAGSPGIISAVGSIMDSGQGFDEDVLDEFVRHLNKNAVQSFIDVLGELRNIRSRRVVIHMLSIVGRNNIEVLLKNLHDTRWYLVRNIVYIIRLIGAKEAAVHLVKALKHNDIRVKKEIIKTLGEMRTSHAVSVIKECMESPEREIRLAAIRVIRHVRAADIKQILMQQISRDDFTDKDYEEKKEFVRALSLWKEDDVIELMMNILKRKRTFFKRNKNDESMACAAYALGLIGDKKNLPLLRKYADLGNAFLKEHVQDAIRRLEVCYERDK